MKSVVYNSDCLAALERSKGKASNKFVNDIFMGRRAVDDLNLLCKVCNALHALEMRFGKLPIKVIYES